MSSGQASCSAKPAISSTALRRPEVRGRWGELTLRRVVELAGMSEHCDFTEQDTRRQSASRRHCVRICWCTCRRRAHLVVDAKTPLDAYMDAIEAQDDDARDRALEPSRHAGGAASPRTRPEKLLGTVRRQPGIRRVVPAGRSVSVRGARRAARTCSSTLSSKASSSQRPRHSWRCSRWLPTVGARPRHRKTPPRYASSAPELHKRLTISSATCRRWADRSATRSMPSIRGGLDGTQRDATGPAFPGAWRDQRCPLAPVEPLEKLVRMPVNATCHRVRTNGFDSNYSYR